MATEEHRLANNLACRKYRKKRSVAQAMYTRSHRRANELQVPHTITLEDVQRELDRCGGYCPIYPSIKLTRGPGRSSATSPTLVTINTDLGFVPGNILVVSFKARFSRYQIIKYWNDLKLNGEFEEAVKDLTDAVTEETDSTSDE